MEVQEERALKNRVGSVFEPYLLLERHSFSMRSKKIKKTHTLAFPFFPNTFYAILG